jgi:hypothetical protein
MIKMEDSSKLNNISKEIPKDILIQLALELDILSLLNFCKSSKRFNTITCQNNLFWFNKLNKDFNYSDTKIYNKDTNYRNLYEMVIGRLTFYEVFLSECNGQNQPPKFWPFIHKAYVKSLNDEDYKNLNKKYPDLKERCGSEFIFEMNGNYPKGTTIYLAYSDDPDLRLKHAYLNKQKAIDKILNSILLQLKYFKQDNEEEYKTFYRYRNKSIEEILEDFKRELLEQGYFKFYSLDTDQFYWYILQEFTL